MNTENDDPRKLLKLWFKVKNLRRI